MNEPASYDFAVLGGGSAGYAAARTADRLGLKTVVIDGAAELGGLCILRGCMPSKTLIESANRALSVRRGAEFGLRSALEAVDTGFIRERKRRLIAEFADYRAAQLTDGRFDLVRGSARFTSPTRLLVAGLGKQEEEIAFRTALIATGSKISLPAIPGLAETGSWTSDTALDAAKIPKSFIVLGGGAVALEFAHYLEGIGRQVSLVQRSAHLLTGMDPEVGDAVQMALATRGVEIHCGTRLLRVFTHDSRKQVVFATGTGERTLEAEEILVALGRRAASDQLGLAEAGLGREGDRVRTSLTQQTTQPHIFAAGDVCGPSEVVHLAVLQGELAARNAARVIAHQEPVEMMDYRLAIFGVFTHPQAASVGLSETEASAGRRGVIVASYPFSDHGKSIVMGETEGFVKMIADARTGELLGAAAVGPEAVELIHTVATAMHFRCTAQEFLRIPFYHPTLSEIWTYPAEVIADKVSGLTRPLS